MFVLKKENEDFAVPAESLVCFLLEHRNSLKVILMTCSEEVEQQVIDLYRSQSFCVGKIDGNAASVIDLGAGRSSQGVNNTYLSSVRLAGRR